MRLRFVRTALLAILLLTNGRAATHRLHVYRNASITVLSIAQGPDGLLWLAASDGLYRFDGFHYDKITAYPFASARFVAFTQDGTLWCADFEGLTRLRNHRIEIVLKQEVDSMAAYPDQLFVRLRNEFARIGLDGSVIRMNDMPRRDLTKDPLGKLWAVFVRPQRACSMNPKQPYTWACMSLPAGNEYQQVVRGHDGKLWAADLEHAFVVENGRAVTVFQREKSRQSDRPAPLFAGPHGQLWFLGEEIHGLYPEVDFRDRAERALHPAIAGVEDSEGRVWTASSGEGLTEWIQDSNWQRWFPEDFGGETPIQVLRDASGAMVAATQKHVYRQNSTGAWTRLASEEHRYYALLAVDRGGFLAATRDAGLVYLSNDGRVLDAVYADAPQTQQFRRLIRDGRGRVWAGAKRALFRIDGKPGSFHVRAVDLPGLRPGETAQAVDFDVDSAGRLWVGYAEGLAWLGEEGRWHKIATDQPITEVRSFAIADDGIWVAHRRSGSFSHLRRHDAVWNVDLFSADAGYVPVDTLFLKRDSRGWIWRGSGAGVHVTNGWDLSPAGWIHMHLGNGLAANEMGQYGFYEDRDGSVWLTGDEGVTHVHPDPGWFSAPQTARPQITRVEADGRVFLPPEPLPEALPRVTKVLKMDVGGLHAPPFRDFPLRYRLLPLFREWKLSRDGSIQFRNLKNDAYRLEMAYAGAGEAPLATYAFRVGSPPAWPFWTGVFSSGAALLLAFRYAPPLERLRFRIAKTVFLLRRRYSRQPYSSSGSSAGAEDYSGATLAGRYKVSRIVCRGGFSVVYDACDVRDGNARCAVKVLNVIPEPRGARQGWLRNRFAHEVSSLRSLDHPGVVRVLDSWISPRGEPCLVMPFLDGETLRSALDRGPIDPHRAARLIKQIGVALSEVHARGIVHRDLKPENLMLLNTGTDAEQAVIIDFGTAGLRSAENQLAATTLMSGSFHYMAPERLTGHYSPATDVFAFAVIALEMLTGKRLSDLDAMFSDASFREELESTLAAHIAPVAATRLAEVLRAAYNPEPRQRPAMVQEWSEEVAAALDSIRRGA